MANQALLFRFLRRRLREIFVVEPLPLPGHPTEPVIPGPARAALLRSPRLRVALLVVALLLWHLWT